MGRIRIDGIQNLAGGEWIKFRILDVVDRGDDYLLSIVSKPLGNIYHMSIRREADGEGKYPIRLWDKSRNKTYPMSFGKREIESQQHFIFILDSIVGTADNGTFEGSTGNKTLIIK